MPDLQSRDQRIAVFKRGIRSVAGASVDPQAVDTRGSTLNLIAAGTGAVAEEVEARSLAKLEALTLSGAKGSDLDALARERTDGEVVRLGATPSVVDLSFTRSSGAFAAVTILKGTKVVAGAVTFATDADLTFGSGARGPLTVSATSTVAGTATRVAAGTLKAFDSTPVDPALVVTNPEAAAGGDEAELDPDLRERVRAYPASKQRGILAALERGALTVAGVRQAVAVEVMDETGEPTGLVIVYIADGNGQANAALTRRVTLALLAYRCGGSPVRVVGSVPTFVDLEIAIAYLDGYATADVQAQARAAVVAAVNRLAPKATLQLSLLLAALRAVPGASVPANAVRKPIGDTIPAAGQTYRTTSSRVTFV